MESCSLKAYPDSAGWSIGYGHHGADVYEGMKITSSQAKEYLKVDVAQAESCIDRNFKGITLNQNEFNALVSMAYNRGCGGLVSSDVYKKIKEGNRTEAAQIWLKSGVTEKGTGKTLGGLVTRRAHEAAMFAGKPVTSTASTSAAMLPEDSPTNSMNMDGSGVSTLKTLGWFGLIAGALWAGNKYLVPYYKKVTA